MKAMILCAGLGTRLKPWTDKHPKALVPVGGIPMLRRVADRLLEQGFCEITLNVHHLGEQIIDYVDSQPDLAGKVCISDERGCLLDTGGGVLHAEHFLAADDKAFLVHNVDILSNADLTSLMKRHEESGRNVSLLVSDRESDRKLVFDENMWLKGWLNRTTGQRLPSSLVTDPAYRQLSFSGIYIMGTEVFAIMRKNGFCGAFPIMDFFLSGLSDLRIGGIEQSDLDLIDIGKPDTLHRADLKV